MSLIVHVFRLCLGLAVLASHAAYSAPEILRVGYFPNVTHAQGVIGAYSSRSGKGWFEERLGDNVKVQWYAFNAGPSAMEAILAGTIDMTYVGPNPSLNAYIRSRGRDIRVMAGAAEGGAALIIAANSGIRTAADFRGKRLATPQLGNTQDVAARAWLQKNGLKVTLTGGDVQVIPTANPDQLALFQQGRLDGVWTVEPWVSRLEMEAHGKALVEQPEALITLLVASEKTCQRNMPLVRKFVAAHTELTRWLSGHPEEAKERLRTALSAETRREISQKLIEAAWKRIRFTETISQAQFDVLVNDAQNVGFLRDAIPLDKFFSRKP